VILRRLAYNHLCQGKYDLALKELDKVFRIFPGQSANLQGKGDVQLIQGDFVEAEKDYRELCVSPENLAQLRGRIGLMILGLSRGQFTRAKEEAKKGIELCLELEDQWTESSLRSNLGYIHIHSGDPTAAIAEVERARGVAEKDEEISPQIIALHMKGLALLEKGSVPEAQASAAEIKRLVDSWLNPKLMRYMTI
jgi:tetratricopeptide (TPR) repeat protein